MVDDAADGNEYYLARAATLCRIVVASAGKSSLVWSKTVGLFFRKAVEEGRRLQRRRRCRSCSAVAGGRFLRRDSVVAGTPSTLHHSLAKFAKSHFLRLVLQSLPLPRKQTFGAAEETLPKLQRGMVVRNDAAKMALWVAFRSANPSMRHFAGRIHPGKEAHFFLKTNDWKLGLCAVLC